MDDATIPPEAAAIIFRPDGSCALVIPEATDEAGGGKMALGHLAAAELAMRVQMGELTIDDLAEAWDKRMRGSS